MATRLVFADGQYCDARPDGGYAVLVRGKGIRTHAGDLPLPANEDLLFVRVSPRGLFEVTGQGQNSGFAWLGSATGWVQHGFAHGVSPCIIDRSGALRIATSAQGSQGYRYIDAANQPVTGDATYGPFHGLSEWTDLGDGLFIGQGTVVSGIVLWDAGRGNDGLLRLDSGNCRFVRAERDGDRVSIAYWSDAGSVLHWTTMAELRALPAVVAPPAPPPPAPPLPPPPPPKEPPVVSSVNHLDVVQRVVASGIRPDGSPEGNLRFIDAVRRGANDGAGFVRSSAGGENTIKYGDGYVRTSRLVYSDGHLYKLIGDAGPGGANTPQWSDEGVQDPGLFVVPLAGDPPAPPSGSGGPGAQIDAELASLLKRLAAAESKIAALEAKPDITAPSVDLRALIEGLPIALQSNDDHYVCAEGGGGGEVNATRTSPGVWETFRVRVQ